MSSQHKILRLVKAFQGRQGTVFGVEKALMPPFQPPGWPVGTDSGLVIMEMSPPVRKCFGVYAAQSAMDRIDTRTQ
jgi:hypothetical protein